MRANYPDIHHFVQVLLERDKHPASTVIADLDGDDYEDLPVVMWRTLNEGQTAHGYWRVILIVTVLLDITDPDTDDLLPHIYSQIRTWDTPSEGVLSSKKIGVESVDDTSVFDIVQVGVVNGKHVSHYAAQFSLTIRDWS